MELHVFNGDCGRDAWKKSGGTAPSLVWLENYLEGILPPPETPIPEFERIRTAELHRLMPELAPERLAAAQKRMDDAVVNRSAGDTVYLWFDACMFDQLILARILFLMRETAADVRLICEDTNWGDSAIPFPAAQQAARRLSRGDREIFASAWAAAAGGIEALDRRMESSENDRFPFLKKALARFREEFPDPEGLGRSERQLLEIVGRGCHAEAEIFHAAGACEEYPFMGDTMCHRLLDGLVRKGRLEIRFGGDGARYRRAEPPVRS